MKILFHITHYSHFFKVDKIDITMAERFKYFYHRHTQFTFVKIPKTNRIVKQPGKVYGISILNGVEYRFHKNQFEELLTFLKHWRIQREQYLEENVPLFEAIATSLTMKSGLAPRAKQEDIIAYISNQAMNSKLVEIQMGKGKGFCSISGLINLQKRTLIIVKPSYMEKWYLELLQFLEVTEDEIRMVKGHSHLVKLIKDAYFDNLSEKIIIISNKTLDRYISYYLEDPIPYISNPDQLCEMLGAGVIILDEIHQAFHAVYKLLCYTHTHMVIGLTATLFTNQEFLQKMYNLIFPIKERYNHLEIDQYIRTYAVGYYFRYGAKIMTREYGSPFYSHNAFEKSIMRNPSLLQGYLKLIKYIVQLAYLDDYQRGDKLAVFASSVKMCTEITQYLKNELPWLDIRRYVQDDPYSNIIDPDIRVTTVMSGGTAIDIPGLIASILTISILSPQANVQTLGRLRKITGRDVKFYYLYCKGVQKHVTYHQDRKKVMTKWSKAVHELSYPGYL